MILNVGIRKINLKRLLIALYIIFLISGFFYVRWALKNEPVKEEKQSKNAGQKVWFVSVTFSIYQGSKVNTYKIATLRNINTVTDILETLRQKETLTYEKTYFTYGTEIDSINGALAPLGYKWRLFEGDKDITKQSGNINLVDNGNYYAKLVKI